MSDHIPYLLREAGSVVLHIGDSGLPLCGASLQGQVDRFYLPESLGPAHGICGDCKAIYEQEKMRDWAKGRW
jgi:hypothetical protein